MKTVLISGAARGIGRGIAVELAECGYNIIINYNDSEAQAKELETRLSKITGALAIKADITDCAEIAKMIVIATHRFGHIDCLVNNAGAAWTGLLSDMSECQYDRLIDINLKGTIALTKAVTADMVSRKKGAVVNISSIWGRSGASCEAVYSATKAAVIGFTQAMSKELAPSGVRVNCVCPGVIDTDMLSNLSAAEKKALADDTPLSRLGTPSDIAYAVEFLLGDKASFITGQTITVDGGFL